MGRKAPSQCLHSQQCSQSKRAPGGLGLGCPRLLLHLLCPFKTLYMVYLLYHLEIAFHSLFLPESGTVANSVPLNLLNVKLASQLIHILPGATQVRPEGLAILPIGRPGCHVTVARGDPAQLLDGGVPADVSGGDSALFGAGWDAQPLVALGGEVHLTLGGAPENGRGLAGLTAVVPRDPRAAKAVEIFLFLRKKNGNTFCLEYFPVKPQDT